MDRTLFCYISPLSLLTKIEVQHFNYKNRYDHHTHSSKKENHQNRKLYLPWFFRRKIVSNRRTRNFRISKKCMFQKVGCSTLLAKIGLRLTYCLQVSKSQFYIWFVGVGTFDVFSVWVARFWQQSCQICRFYRISLKLFGLKG